MFQEYTFLPGIGYIYLSYGVFLLTWYFLYISFSSNKFVSKKTYTLCAVVTAIVLISWAFTLRAAGMVGFSITYLILSVLGVSLLLSVRWLRSNKFYTFLLSFMTCLIYIFCTFFPGFIIGSIFELHLKDFTNVLLQFYFSLFFSVLFLLLTYLPRRERKRRDKAAVIVSLASVLLIGCGVVLNFSELLSGTALWVSDIAVCLLTIASWFLLLSTGMEPVNTTPEAGTRV